MRTQADRRLRPSDPHDGRIGRVQGVLRSLPPATLKHIRAVAVHESWTFGEAALQVLLRALQVLLRGAAAAPGGHGHVE